MLKEVDGDPTTGTAHPEAEEDVRRPVDAAPATDVEHGASVHDDREPEEHGKFILQQSACECTDLGQMATVDAMKTANKEMKKQYKGIDIDKIEVSLVNLACGSGMEAENCRASITTWRT